jgi:hypothetical protein
MLNISKINKVVATYNRSLVNNPSNLYKIKGLIINNDPLTVIISSNTYRGFHKINKNGKGCKCIAHEYFESNQKRIIKKLGQITNRYELDKFSEKLTTELKQKLTNIKKEKLKSYNKVRKLIDLYLEHLVLLSPNTCISNRNKLLLILFIPLDQHILTNMRDYLKPEKIPLRPTMSSVIDKGMYDRIQKKLSDFCKQHKIPAPIALDLLWRDRYEKNGNDFMELTKAAIK